MPDTRDPESLFHEARALWGEARARFLSQECGGDAGLRAQVEALLAADAEAGSFLQERPEASRHDGNQAEDPDATIPIGRPGSAASHATERAGQIIDRFKLLQQIGEGGFGSVWMAEQREPVVRKVALKIIKLGMDTRQVIARFEAERQALALMDHANIAKVLDAGATETGRPYFVMELCSGDSITEYCDGKNLTIPERLELFAQVCQAVQHAHQKGLIHRDIKPSNILVSTQDGQPHAKVIDFGIAKATSSRLTDKTLFTEHRQLIGTPQYMSPEQAEGSLDIDTRTDVYSLGVLLYELLTGVTPFDPKKLRSAAYEEMQRIIREVEPPKPSTRLSQNATTISAVAAHRHTEPRRLGTIIRGDLDWITLKAMEKDRARRYETANGLATDIRRYLAGEPVVAAPPSSSYRIRKFIRRHRMGVIAGSLVAAVLVLGVIGTTGGLLWALDENARANLAAQSEALAKRKAEANAAAALRAADEAERAAYQAQMLSAAHAVEDQRMDAARALLAATPPRLRGWEFEHLTSRLDRSLPTPFPADWRIARLSRAAASGATAVLRTDPKGLSGWVVLGPDWRTERFFLPGMEDGMLEISPDGSRAVWTPGNGTDPRPATFWNLDTGNLMTTIALQPLPSARDNQVVTWSPTGDRFLISRDGSFEVYEGRTGALLERRNAEGMVHFTQDSRWILLHGARTRSDVDARSLRLLDARTFEPQPEGFRFESPVGSYSISFWQSRVACAVEDGTLQVLDIEDGVLRPRFKVAPGMGVLTAPAWSPDGRLIAVGTAVGRVGVWETESQASRGEFAEAQAAINSLLFLPDSGDVWTCDLEGHHRVWPVGSASGGVLTAHKSFVYPVVLSKGGGLLLSGGWDGASGHAGGLKLWDARTGALVAEHGRPNEIVWSADLTPDSRYAVAGYWADAPSLRRTDVLDLWTGRVAMTFGQGADPLPPVCVVHPDGRRLAASFPTGATCVWDLLSGKVLWESADSATREPGRDHSSAVAVSPDGHVLALGDRDTGIRLVDVDSYADLRRWDAHADLVWSLSFSPDGRQLLSTSEDGTIGVWDVATGARVARLVGHNADVFCAAMSPDGTRIASGGRDRYLRLWDTTRFENVAQLGGHKDYIYSITWSPDGRQLISGSGDSTVRIWDTRTLAEQVAAVRERAEAMPAIEARVARARAGAQDPAAALEAVLAAPELGPRERELARQAAARFAFGGMPAYYRAPRAAAPIAIDGRIDEAEWGAAPWSDAFVDIEGDAKPRPRFETRMRMLWDDTNLYIAARLEEPHVSATLSQRDDIVLNDNDFEVFIDPEGDARNYYEFEFNALNAAFDLLLVRPYGEGGPARHDWNLAGLRSAVHVDGTLNDPRDTDRAWTIEMALPWSSLAEYAKCPSPPRPGDVWRINFSRVEWQYDIVDGRYVKRPDTKEDNWVWTPQHVVNMHVPREWGFVEFVGQDR